VEDRLQLQGPPDEAAAAFEPLAVAGPVDEDAAHGLGRGGEEVPPAVPARGVARAYEAQVGLVDQGRGLEGLPGRLAGEPLGGQLA
jgi:hypothetical protein